MIEIAYSHADFFIRNMVAYRIKGTRFHWFGYL